MFELSVCAVIKNEARYLEEWLAFHIEAGVEHFFLYDNGSTDQTLEIIDNHPAITVIDWPDRPAQLAAYQHCLNTFGSRWLAFIDADEFLFSPLKLDLRTALLMYQDAPAVVVHWLMFGSGGQKEYKPLPVTTRFFQRAAEVNQHVKSIVQPSRTLRVGFDPHRFKCDAPAVNERHERVSESPLIKDGTANILRIHHYAIKSEQEYRERCQLARSDNDELRDFASNFAAMDRNERVDRSAQIYTSAIHDYREGQEQYSL